MNRQSQATKQLGPRFTERSHTSSILENLACGIVHLDANLNIMTLNQWFLDHSELINKNYVGENFLTIFPDMKNTQLDKSIDAALRYKIKSFLTPDINLNPLPLYSDKTSGMSLSKDNTPLCHAIYISPVEQEDGAVSCLLQIEKLTDATIKNRLYHEQSLRMFDEAETLRQSSRIAEKANRAKSEFLALMSHELRTPLNAIIGFADILKNEILGPHKIAQYKDYSNDISNAGNHLLNLINDILDISKIDAGKYSLHEEVVDVVEIVHSAENLVRPQINQNKQNISVTYPEDLPDLKADSRGLKQMILNLLSNAVKFTPDEGSITVDIQLSDEGDMVISVKDNGIGIAPHEIPLIMEPFIQSESNLTRQKQGTGLGLSLVKKMVEMHGGNIEMESQIGQGSTVSLSFPEERIVEI